MQVYLIRHSSPDIAKGICYGQADIPVNAALFAQELETIRSKIPSTPEAYYCSPLKRCLDLAGQLAASFQIDARLKELDFGSWELQKWSELPAADVQLWMDDFVNEAAGQAESYRELHHRSCDFLVELLQQPYQSAGIITHAGVIRSMISWALDLPLENAFRISIPYGAVVELALQEHKQMNQLKSII